jgi:hypothetical protein
MGATRVFFEPDSLFKKRLKDVIASAEKQALNAVAEAGRRFRSRLGERRREPGAPQETFDDAPDDYDPAEEMINQAAALAQLADLPRDLLEILMQVRSAILRDDARAVDRLQAKALKRGVSPALLEAFLEIVPRPDQDSGPRKPKGSPGDNQPELDLF